MQETVIETFDDVKFIEGVTKMNQENWQAYFSAGFPNGIYEGFTHYMATLSNPGRIYDGTAFVNGLCVEIKTDDGYTEYPYESATDRFFCLRINIGNGTAQLIVKTEIASDYKDTTISTEIGKFIADESYCCERNDLVYDLPLWYLGPTTATITTTVNNLFGRGFDLRRMVQNKKDFIVQKSQYISGDNKYEHEMISAGNYGEGIRAELNLVNIPDGATIRVTGGAQDIAFAIAKYPASDNPGWYWANNNIDSPVNVIFETTSNSWTVFDQGGSGAIHYNFPAGKTTLTLKIHFLGYSPVGLYVSKPTFRFFIEELA